MTEVPKVEALLDKMEGDLRNHISKQGIEDFELVGIRSGGVWLADALKQRLGRSRDNGELNISFYRDDFTKIGLHPEVGASKLPFNVENKHVILVDDVLMSGRTVRAAMNELFDYGRPASIQLVVLIDLQRPELPISPSVTGAKMSLSSKQRIKLEGPKSLALNLYTLAPQ